MSRQKRQVRQRFREQVLERDGHRCLGCKQRFEPDALDAHHIIDRNDMPNGGYVTENGATLCQTCHPLAEAEHQGKDPHPGLSRAELFAAIGSSESKARHADSI